MTVSAAAENGIFSIENGANAGAIFGFSELEFGFFPDGVRTRKFRFGPERTKNNFKLIGFYHFIYCMFINCM